jgi:radical SAM protein with 4Fe4S-binding SPASM domain
MHENFKDPFFFQWHITDRCNLNCRHCYRENIKKEFDFNVLLKILDQYQELAEFKKKGGRIQFTGGEPLLRDDLEDLVRESVKRKFPARILTSGVLLDSGRAVSLKKAGLKIVQISIEGDREIHDYIRGENNYDLALKGAAAARDAGLEVTFSMTLSKVNMNKIEHVFQLAEKHAHRVGYSRLIVTGNALELKDQVLSASEWEKSLKLINKLKKKAVIDVPYRDPLWTAIVVPRFFPRICRNTVSGCSAGYNQIVVDSDGDIYPCRRLPIVIGNTEKTTLLEVWKNSEVIKNLQDRSLLTGKCGKCRLKYLCGGCRGVAWAATGDYLAGDPQCFR